MHDARRRGPIAEVVNAKLTFEVDTEGRATAVVLHQFSATMRAAKVNEQGHLRGATVESALRTSSRCYCSPWQMYSKISPPGIHDDFVVAEMVHFTDHGAV